MSLLSVAIHSNVYTLPFSRQCGQKWSKELAISSIFKGTLADINESSFNDIKLVHEKVKKNVKSAAPITFTKKE